MLRNRNFKDTNFNRGFLDGTVKSLFKDNDKYFTTKKCSVKSLNEIKKYNDLIKKYINHYKHEYEILVDEYWDEYNKALNNNEEEKAKIIKETSSSLKTIVSDITKTLLRVFLKTVVGGITIFTVIYRMNRPRSLSMSAKWITKNPHHSGEAIIRNSAASALAVGGGIAAFKAIDKIK